MSYRLEEGTLIRIRNAAAGTVYRRVDPICFKKRLRALGRRIDSDWNQVGNEWDPPLRMLNMFYLVYVHFGKVGVLPSSLFLKKIKISLPIKATFINNFFRMKERN